MTDNKDISTAVSEYYSQKVREFGATPKGVDWRDQASQENRFRQLLRLFEHDLSAGVMDVGCGYGGMLSYLRQHGFAGEFIGIDLSADMIAKARELFGNDDKAQFKKQDQGAPLDGQVDFAVASGIFNVRLSFDADQWFQYILETLHDMDRVAGRGFAFNCLTSYSDAPLMRDYLYYADPCRLFDYCKRTFSKQVALLHDYGLYEFTLLVRKDVP